MGAPDMSKKGMNWFYWAGFTFGFAYFPGLCRWWLGREPAAQLDLSDEKRLELTLSQFLKSKSHPKDVAIVKNEGFQLYMRSSRQAFAQGMHAFAQDGRLISTDWGFRIEDIRAELPVQLWYGKLDHNCPVIHGEQIAKRLGAQAHLRVENETHGSIHVNWREQILEALVKYL
jgi:pimeloyl-ACP methyl ester carboxylesterase